MNEKPYYKELKKYYEDLQLTSREVANLLNINKTTVLKYARLYGFKHIKDRVPAKSINKRVIPKEELEELYYNKQISIPKLAEIFECSEDKVYSHLKKYDLLKDRKHYSDFSKEELERLYIIDNMSTRDIADKFKISRKALSIYLKELGIVKDREVLKNQIVEKSKQTCLKKYGVTSYSKTHEFSETYRQTCLERYGVPNTGLLTGNQVSKLNLKWAESLENYKMEYVVGYYSYDFLLININVLLEINPSYTHSDKASRFRPRNIKYHLNRSLNASKNGYHCIHVWDWDDKDKILNLFKRKERIPARKVEIKQIFSKEANIFNNKYHLQNTCRGQNIIYGLYYNQELVSLMSFGKPRYNKDYQWELLRYTTHPNYMIIGGAEKLFKHFIQDFTPESVISYCDYSKFSGQVYEKLGFVLKGIANPSKHWYNSTSKKHITQNLLNMYGVDKLLGTNYGKGTNNQELMLQHGFYDVWDCGQMVFVWKST